MNWNREKTVLEISRNCLFKGEKKTYIHLSSLFHFFIGEYLLKIKIIFQ